jgi:hypothetical protein
MLCHHGLFSSGCFADMLCHHGLFSSGCFADIVVLVSLADAFSAEFKPCCLHDFTILPAIIVLSSCIRLKRGGGSPLLSFLAVHCVSRICW